MFKCDGELFYNAEKLILTSINSMDEISVNIDNLLNMNMGDYPFSTDVKEICDGLKDVDLLLKQLSSLVSNARSRLLSLNKVFYVQYEFSWRRNFDFDKNKLDFNNTRGNIGGLQFYADADINSYIDYFIKTNPKLKTVINESINSMNLLAFIDSYEFGAVANYLFSDGKYNKYISKYITEDKQNFICYNDGTGRDDRNFGFGILHYLDGKYETDKISYYKELGIDITDPKYNNVGDSLMPVDVVLAVQEKVLEDKKNIVIRQIGKENYDKLSVQQQHCLIDIAYQGCTTWSDLKKLLDEGRTKEEIVELWPRLTSTTYNNQARADARVELWVNDKYTDEMGREIGQKIK